MNTSQPKNRWKFMTDEMEAEQRRLHKLTLVTGSLFGGWGNLLCTTEEFFRYRDYHYLAWLDYYGQAEEVKDLTFELLVDSVFSGVEYLTTDILLRYPNIIV